MKVKIGRWQDVVITLGEAELLKLAKNTEGFYDSPLRQAEPSAECFVYLGHSKDIEKIFVKARSLEKGIKMLLPAEPRYPYLINLSNESLEELKAKKRLGVRYMDAKLIIEVEDAMD